VRKRVLGLVIAQKCSGKQSMYASGSAVNQGDTWAQWATRELSIAAAGKCKIPVKYGGIVGEDKGLACGRGQLSISILQGKIAWLLSVRQNGIKGMFLGEI
jgi:hypothetical protein